MNGIGASVASNTVYGQKKQLKIKHKELFEEQVTAYVDHATRKSEYTNILEIYSTPGNSLSYATPISYGDEKKPQNVGDVTMVTVQSSSEDDIVDQANVHCPSTPLCTSNPLLLFGPSQMTTTVTSSQTTICTEYNVTFSNTQQQPRKGMAESTMLPLEVPSAVEGLHFKNADSCRIAVFTPTLTYSLGNGPRSVKDAKKQLHRIDLQDSTPIEVLGDNFDIAVSPNMMTKSSQRKSWHWFLLISKLVQTMDNTLSNKAPKADILKMPSSEFLPNAEDCKSLQADEAFYVLSTLVKHVGIFKGFTGVLPRFLKHDHMKTTSQKTTFLDCDLLDENENLSDGIISILQTIHKEFVPHHNTSHPLVAEKVVFEGDVLTCERALSGQQAMQNGKSDFENLKGVYHRPGGLHRIMNFCLVYTYCKTTNPVQFLCSLLVSLIIQLLIFAFQLSGNNVAWVCVVEIVIQHHPVMHLFYKSTCSTFYAIVCPMFSAFY